jgi:E2/UBC family protein E
MTLPELDIARLTERGATYSVTPEGGMLCVVMQNYQLPDGYDTATSDLLLRLSPGYPDVQPDMWWFNPPIRRKDGKGIQATEVVEHHMGKPWQRWSRHFNPGQWRPGTDNLESYLALVRSELERCAR